VNDIRPGRVSLDEVDRRILRELAADARLANNALAATVGIAPSTCLTRVRRLVADGVIRGFHAEVSPEALGLGLQAIVVVRLQAGARGRIGDFGGWLASLPGVLNVFFLAGTDDFQVHVAADSPAGLRDFVVENLSASPDVASTETHLIFEHLRTGTSLV
jgi:DNA-binding Lrp family transcriptional regulator